MLQVLKTSWIELVPAQFAMERMPTVLRNIIDGTQRKYDLGL